MGRRKMGAYCLNDLKITTREITIRVLLIKETDLCIISIGIKNISKVFCAWKVQSIAQGSRLDTRFCQVNVWRVELG